MPPPAAAPAVPSPPVRSLALVEVRKNVEATTWYDARLRDLSGGLAVVAFEGGVWPEREVPCATVRARPEAPPPTPAAAGGSAAEPGPSPLAGLRPGDPVEVRVAASARNPQGWALGALGAAAAAPGKGVVHVRLGDQDHALQAASLRPVSRERPLDPMLLARKAVPVAEELRAWLATDDARGCLEQVRVTVGLALAGAGNGAEGLFLGGSSDAPKVEQARATLPDSVILLGGEQATRQGEMVLRVHLMHQLEVEAFHTRRARKMQQLQELHARICASEAAAKVAFEVDAGLIGRTCGKGGERVRRVEAELGVEVRVLDGAGPDDARTVVVSGESDEIAARGREALELFREQYPVPEERVSWMLGKANRQLHEIARKAGLIYAEWTGKELELCGLRHQIEDAVMLLDDHSGYFPVYQEMVRQQDDIKRSFDALAEAAAAAGLAPPPRAARRRGSKNGSDSRGPNTVAETPAIAASPGATDAEWPPRARGGGGRGRGTTANGKGGAPDAADADGARPAAPAGARGRARGRGRGAAEAPAEPQAATDAAYGRNGSGEHSRGSGQGRGGGARGGGPRAGAGPANGLGGRGLRWVPKAE